MVTRLALVIALAALAAPVVHADDPPQTPEQKKAAQKEKDLKKAKDDLEKELKGKKVDPAPALSMLDKLATQCNLEVAPAKDLVRKILSKKIPWADASAAADEKLRGAVDQKTQKIDLKKFTTDFTKWITDWKPPAAAPANPPAPPPAPPPPPANGGK